VSVSGDGERDGDWFIFKECLGRRVGYESRRCVIDLIAYGDSSPTVSAGIEYP